MLKEKRPIGLYGPNGPSELKGWTFGKMNTKKLSMGSKNKLPEFLVEPNSTGSEYSYSRVKKIEIIKKIANISKKHIFPRCVGFDFIFFLFFINQN